MCQFWDTSKLTINQYHSCNNLKQNTLEDLFSLRKKLHFLWQIKLGSDQHVLRSIVYLLNCTGNVIILITPMLKILVLTIIQVETMESVHQGRVTWNKGRHYEPLLNSITKSLCDFSPLQWSLNRQLSEGSLLNKHKGQELFFTILHSVRIAWLVFWHVKCKAAKEIELTSKSGFFLQWTNNTPFYEAGKLLLVSDDQSTWNLLALLCW